jgi:murein DD-endopeptidase MepM/ murein hydrolase activator NlpD
VRKFAAATLAIPVLARVYLAAALRPRNAARLGLSLGAGTLVVSGALALVAPGPTTARPPTDAVVVAADAFRLVEVPDPSGAPLAAIPAPPGTARILASRTEDDRARLDASFVIAFDRPVDLASVSQALRIEPPIAGALEVPGRRGPVDRLVFQPAEQLVPDTVYEVRLEAGARDADGRRLGSAEALVVRTIRSAAVVRFRPRNGWADVEPSALLSVRFTEPMDPAATTPVFSATAGGRPIEGRTWWAEGGTVLVLDPAAALRAGSRVVLAVAAGARSRAGAPLAAPASAMFTVARDVPRAGAGVGAGGAGVGAGGAATVGPTSAGWAWPHLGAITQRFGQSLTRYGTHHGIDIDGSTGDPVRAARDGQVIAAGWLDSCGGLEVRIDHGDGYVSWYRHLSAVLVTVGQSVDRGRVVGRMGNTGCSLGSHLHFAIQRDGAWVDPERYLPER